MGTLELIFISFGLAMDAFVVAVGKGLAMKRVKSNQIFMIAFCFGFFQGFMPIIGYRIGSSFDEYLWKYNHWIVFCLLAVIGGKMILDVFSSREDDLNQCALFRVEEILLLAIATSIEALAVGVTFAVLPNIDIIPSVICIGVVAFIASYHGVKLGVKFGHRFDNYAEIFGGLILIGIGVKILFEHLGLF